MLDGVGQGLLGDPEERELHVRRRAGAVGALEPDLAAGQALDPEDQPVERGTDAQVVQDREAQVAADRAQPVGHRPGHLGALRVARRIETAHEQGQLLQGVVVDVRGDARTFGLGRGDDEVALELGAADQAGERTDGEPTGRDDRADPDEEQPRRAR